MSPKERRFRRVPQTLFLVFGSIASITNTTSTVDEMAQQTAADTPLTRAMTSVCSSVKLEQFFKLSKAAIFFTFVDFIFSCDFLLLKNYVGIESLIFHIWLYHSSCYYYTVIQVT